MCQVSGGSGVLGFRGLNWVIKIVGAVAGLPARLKSLTQKRLTVPLVHFV
jgi:hypothetical protein